MRRGVVLTVLRVAWLRSPPIELAFDVGEQEKHRVFFRLKKLLGNVAVTVGDLPVGSDLHRVRVEKGRSLATAGFRAQTMRADVDQMLAAEDTA